MMDAINSSHTDVYSSATLADDDSRSSLQLGSGTIPTRKRHCPMTELELDISPAVKRSCDVTVLPQLDGSSDELEGGNSAAINEKRGESNLNSVSDRVLHGRAISQNSVVHGSTGTSRDAVSAFFSRYNPQGLLQRPTLLTMDTTGTYPQQTVNNLRPLFENKGHASATTPLDLFQRNVAGRESSEQQFDAKLRFPVLNGRLHNTPGSQALGLNNFNSSAALGNSFGTNRPSFSINPQELLKYPFFPTHRNVFPDGTSSTFSNHPRPSHPFHRPYLDSPFDSGLDCDSLMSSRISHAPQSESILLPQSSVPQPRHLSGLHSGSMSRPPAAGGVISKEPRHSLVLYSGHGTVHQLPASVHSNLLPSSTQSVLSSSKYAQESHRTVDTNIYSAPQNSQNEQLRKTGSTITSLINDCRRSENMPRFPSSSDSLTYSDHSVARLQYSVADGFVSRSADNVSTSAFVRSDTMTMPCYSFGATVVGSNTTERATAKPQSQFSMQHLMAHQSTAKEPVNKNNNAGPSLEKKVSEWVFPPSLSALRFIAQSPFSTDPGVKEIPITSNYMAASHSEKQSVVAPVFGLTIKPSSATGPPSFPGHFSHQQSDASGSNLPLTAPGGLRPLWPGQFSQPPPVFPPRLPHASDTSHHLPRPPHSSSLALSDLLRQHTTAQSSVPRHIDQLGTKDSHDVKPNRAAQFESLSLEQLKSIQAAMSCPPSAGSPFQHSEPLPRQPVAGNTESRVISDVRTPAGPVAFPVVPPVHSSTEALEKGIAFGILLQDAVTAGLSLDSLESADPPSSKNGDAVLEKKRYDAWLLLRTRLLGDQIQYLEQLVSQQKKIKKNFTFKQKNAQKNGASLSQEDSDALAAAENEQSRLQKRLHQLRKDMRKHQILQSSHTSYSSLPPCLPSTAGPHGSVNEHISPGSVRPTQYSAKDMIGSLRSPSASSDGGYPMSSHASQPRDHHVSSQVTNIAINEHSRKIDDAVAKSRNINSMQSAGRQADEQVRRDLEQRCPGPVGDGTGSNNISPSYKSSVATMAPYSSDDMRVADHTLGSSQAPRGSVQQWMLSNNKLTSPPASSSSNLPLAVQRHSMSPEYFDRMSHQNDTSKLNQGAIMQGLARVSHSVQSGSVVGSSRTTGNSSIDESYPWQPFMTGHCTLSSTTAGMSSAMKSPLNRDLLEGRGVVMASGGSGFGKDERRQTISELLSRRENENSQPQDCRDTRVPLRGELVSVADSGDSKRLRTSLDENNSVRASRSLSDEAYQSVNSAHSFIKSSYNKDDSLLVRNRSPPPSLVPSDSNRGDASNNCRAPSFLSESVASASYCLDNESAHPRPSEQQSESSCVFNGSGTFVKPAGIVKRSRGRPRRDISDSPAGNSTGLKVKDRGVISLGGHGLRGRGRGLFSRGRGRGIPGSRPMSSNCFTKPDELDAVIDGVAYDFNDENDAGTHVDGEFTKLNNRGCGGRIKRPAHPSHHDVLDATDEFVIKRAVSDFSKEPGVGSLATKPPPDKAERRMTKLLSKLKQLPAFNCYEPIVRANPADIVGLVPGLALSSTTTYQARGSYGRVAIAGLSDAYNCLASLSLLDSLKSKESRVPVGKDDTDETASATENDEDSAEASRVKINERNEMSMTKTAVPEKINPSDVKSLHVHDQKRVTLTLTPEASDDVKSVLLSIAALLRVTVPSTYEIIRNSLGSRAASIPNGENRSSTKHRMPRVICKEEAFTFQSLMNTFPKFCRHCSATLLGSNGFNHLRLNGVASFTGSNGFVRTNIHGASAASVDSSVMTSVSASGKNSDVVNAMQTASSCISNIHASCGSSGDIAGESGIVKTEAVCIGNNMGEADNINRFNVSTGNGWGEATGQPQVDQNDDMKMKKTSVIHSTADVKKGLSELLNQSREFCSIHCQLQYEHFSAVRAKEDAVAAALKAKSDEATEAARVNSQTSAVEIKLPYEKTTQGSSLLKSKSSHKFAPKLKKVKRWRSSLVSAGRDRNQKTSAVLSLRRVDSGLIKNKEQEINGGAEENSDQVVDNMLGAHSFHCGRTLVDQRVCVLCQEVGDGDTNGTGRLLNMDANEWVHVNCALWSYDVYETMDGSLVNVASACEHGQAEDCMVCHRGGATVACNRSRCNNVYHVQCALKAEAMFFEDKTMLCKEHAPEIPTEDMLRTLAVLRRVSVDRSENRQIAKLLKDDDQSFRIRSGSLILHSFGQLLFQQIQTGNFNSTEFIYPVGYKCTRYYWSYRRLHHRCRYICSIEDAGGYPEFVIHVQEKGLKDVIIREDSCTGAWLHILEPLEKMRRENDLVNMFSSYMSGEDLFGLTLPCIQRVVESLPGVELIHNCVFRYGRSPMYVLPLAINPTGCIRTEPKMKIMVKRSHTLLTSCNVRQHTSSVISSSAGPGGSSSNGGGSEFSITQYMKQFTSSKSQRYRSLRTEWRNNVYLRRSNVQGLGLFAARELEKHTMVIEYIGQLIRNEVSEFREKVYEQQNRGVYMFRIDDNTVIDATMAGGPARYINHSCNPNCFTEVVPTEKGDKIIIIAKRKINGGEELTYDYKFDFEDEKNKIPCLCGASNCCKWMN